MVESLAMDSYRYCNRVTRMAVKAWIKREPHRQIPWTALRKPLARSTVALISSAAVAMRDDRPFDQDKERRDPWHPDEGYRLIGRDATEHDVRLYHLHINTTFGERDLDCVMPLRRLKELEEAGEIGCSAPTHYSYQGFVLKPRELLEKSAPAMVKRMKAEGVDAALLVPV
jgi:D-proline reductase (dithiol) PrdB